jgi:hypothetical protein
LLLAIQFHTSVISGERERAPLKKPSGNTNINALTLAGDDNPLMFAQRDVIESAPSHPSPARRRSSEIRWHERDAEGIPIACSSLRRDVGDGVVIPNGNDTSLWMRDIVKALWRMRANTATAREHHGGEGELSVTISTVAFDINRVRL